MAAERLALTPEEVLLLTDPEALKRVLENGPFRIAYRNVSGLKIADLSFQRITFEEVTFSNVVFSRTQFIDANLNNVAFDSCQFESVNFDTCLFADVVTTICTFSDAKFTCCNLKGWRSEGCNFTNLVWLACNVVDWSDRSGLFANSTWDDVTVSNPVWHGTKLSQHKLYRLRSTLGMLTAVTFVECESTGVSFQGTTLDGIELLFGRFSGLIFEGASGAGLRIVEAQCHGVGLIDCRRLSGVTITAGEMHGFVAQNCKELSMLTFGYTTLYDMVLQDCQVCGLFVNHSRLLSEHLVRGSTLDGLDFEDSAICHLSIESSTISTCLRIAQAQFEELSLKQVNYSPSLEYETANVSYERGDSFPS